MAGKSLKALVWSAVSTRPQADEDEKFSIPQQIADAEALARRNGWQVTDVLKVPGHSRSYRTLDALADEARKRGIDAFDRLIRHFEARDFDIFICRDANRFARKASLLHYIAETIVEDCGATIYSMADNLMVTADNVDMWATMQGYKVRAEVKWLVSARENGVRRRAARGLNVGRLPFSHLLERDEQQAPVRIVIDETKRRLFDDLVRLVLAGTPFSALERGLAARGHVAADGLPYGDNIMYTFLYNPLTWGHIAFGYYRSRSRGKGRLSGPWVFDDTEPVPDGVELHRDILPPVYAGEQADRLKAELRRRRDMKGRRRPATTHAFSGLFVCGVCDRTLSVFTQPTADGGRAPVYVWCNTHSKKFLFQPACDQRGMVPVGRVQAYLDGLLRRLLETGDLSELVPETTDYRARIEQLDTEQTICTEQLDSLILLQAQAHPGARGAYQKQIDRLAERLENLERHTRAVRREADRQNHDERRVRAALNDIADVSARFWQLPPVEINQFWHRLLGNRRFVILDGQIIGLRTAPARQSRRPRATS